MNSTNRDRARQIAAWFRDHEDGEFVLANSERPALVTPFAAPLRTVMYLTKTGCAERVLRAFAWGNAATIFGREGLPDEDDLRRFVDLSPDVRRGFVGDADPPDLLVFAYLREYVAIDWLGVRDEWMQAGPRFARSTLEIPLSPAERQAMLELPEFCPDYRRLIGDDCAATLERGFKIELEGALRVQMRA